MPSSSRVYKTLITHSITLFASLIKWLVPKFIGFTCNICISYLWSHSGIPAQVVAIPELQFTNAGTREQYLEMHINVFQQARQLVIKKNIYIEEDQTKDTSKVTKDDSKVPFV